ncbi:ROK family protein [Microbacterium sp. gxy059]|uniref:ROK family protein n=1 Tax=Microbacterium sp. gxy059 TaxID=2957199 RepID=UPI003D96FD26
MARPSAKSPQLMRQMNARLVARFALDADEFTAADAMAATDLTRATVLGVCADLVAAGWLEERADSRAAGLTSKGRPARRYRLRTAAGAIVGLDADEHRYVAHVTDLRGSLLGSVHAPIGGRDIGPAGRVEAARSAIRDAVIAAGRSPDDVLLTVVGIPAPADASGRSPEGDGGFWSLMNAHLADALDGTVIVENDANLAALAESAASDDGLGENVATLLTGERLGAGLIVDGRLLRGPRGGAGEMRFLRLIFPEEHATDGAGALARRWAREAVLATDEPSALRAIDADRIEAEDVLEAARAGDPLAQRIIDRLGERLARVAFALGSLLDVEKVVVCGAIAASLAPVLDVARRILDTAYEPPVPELVPSALGGDVVVRGAIERGRTSIQQDPLAFLPGG